MITAQTEDGRKVILYEDGRWEYIQEGESDISNSQDYDFRKVNWGDTKEQVRINETAKFSFEEGIDLIYTSHIAEMEVMIIYSFESNKLDSAKVLILEKYGKRDTYLTKFNSLKAVLTKKYGDAIEDQIIWRNNIYKNTPVDHGLALKLGHVGFFANWETNSMGIFLQLDGKGDVHSFHIYYQAKTKGSVSETEIMNDL